MAFFVFGAGIKKDTFNYFVKYVSLNVIHGRLINARNDGRLTITKPGLDFQHRGFEAKLVRTGTIKCKLFIRIEFRL